MRETIIRELLRRLGISPEEEAAFGAFLDELLSRVFRDDELEEMIRAFLSDPGGTVERLLRSLVARALEELAERAGLPPPALPDTVGEAAGEALRLALRALLDGTVEAARSALDQIAALLGLAPPPAPPPDAGGGTTTPSPPTPGSPPGGGGGPTGPDGTNPTPNPGEEDSVALTFEFHRRNIPASLATNAALQEQYVSAVKRLIRLRGADESDEVLVASVVGGLLRSGQFNPTTSSFALFVRKLLDELLVVRGLNGEGFTGLDVRRRIAEILEARGGGGSDGGPTVAYQLFAFVGDEAMKTIARVPMDDTANFESRVESAILAYASGADGFEGLELPPLDGGTDTEIVPENIQAVALIYAANHLDQGAKVLPVVDIIADLYDDGLIPITFDDAGQALDQYRFAADERVPEGKRASYYARMFGAKGADVSKAVQPNAGFETLLMRFMSTVAEYERERDLAGVFELGFERQGRVGMITGEHVRKAGRELAANLSLYGWGAAHTVARRINTHLRTALQILAMPQIQQAFGATNEWQVIERVCQQELKTIPDILKHRTMAESGKAVLDIIARNPGVWRQSGGDVFAQLGPEEAEALRNHARYWLTVNNVTDSTLHQMSQPVETKAIPSFPGFSGVSPAGQGGNEGVITQLRNMMASGQTPTPEQLQRLLMN